MGRCSSRVDISEAEESCAAKTRRDHAHVDLFCVEYVRAILLVEILYSAKAVVDVVNGIETGHMSVAGFQNIAFESVQIFETGVDLLDEVDEWQLTRALQGERLNVGYVVAECVDRLRGQRIVGIVKEKVLKRSMANVRRRLESVMVRSEVSYVERAEIRTD